MNSIRATPTTAKATAEHTRLPVVGLELERAAEGTLRHLGLLLRREDRLRTPRRVFARTHACRNGGARQACLGFCGRPACGLCGSSRARRTANVRCTVALCSPPSVRSARLQQSSAAAYSPALYAFCALASRLFREDMASGERPWSVALGARLARGAIEDSGLTFFSST